MEGRKKDFFEVLEEAYEKRKPAFFSALLSLFAFTFFSAVATVKKPISFTHYFLSVGQGDSQAVMLHGGAVALIDGGPPNGRVLRELEKILPFYKRSVDIVFLTHPEEDHFGGLIELLKRFDVGLVVTNGDDNDMEAYYEFKKILEQENIKTMMVFVGDKVKQGDITFSVLWPPKEIIQKTQDKHNENALVLLAEQKTNKTLYLSDVSEDIEEKLAAKIGVVDILKVGHHGSKTSSGEMLLFTIQPAAAFIGVGKNNYGHPSSEVLSRLISVGAQVFRTDRDGTLGARFNGNTVQIFHIKQ